jgi:hypothetical protein
MYTESNNTIETSKLNFLALSYQMQQILILIYRFRFLHTKHIQTLLSQKAYSRNKLRLNILHKTGYITGYYTRHIATGRTPTIYSLQKNGIDFIKSLTGMNSYLQKLNNEPLPRYSLLPHSLTVADIAVTLTKYCNSKNLPLKLYTKADIANTKDYFLIKPDIFLKAGDVSYFIELDMGTESEKRMQNKLQAYINHNEKNNWQSYYSDLYPCINFVSLSIKRMESLKRRFEQVLTNNNYPPITVKLTTLSELTVTGLENDICLTPFRGDERFLFIT